MEDFAIQYSVQSTRFHEVHGFSRVQSPTSQTVADANICMHNTALEAGESCLTGLLSGRQLGPSGAAYNESKPTTAVHFSLYLAQKRCSSCPGHQYMALYTVARYEKRSSRQAYVNFGLPSHWDLYTLDAVGNAEPFQFCRYDEISNPLEPFLELLWVRGQVDPHKASEVSILRCTKGQTSRT